MSSRQLGIYDWSIGERSGLGRYIMESSLKMAFKPWKQMRSLQGSRWIEKRLKA